jgi:hypothetical protein
VIEELKEGMQFKVQNEHDYSYKPTIYTIKSVNKKSGILIVEWNDSITNEKHGHPYANFNQVLEYFKFGQWILIDRKSVV